MAVAMTPIRTLLVDDEFLALRLLEGFLKQLPGNDLEIVGTFQQPLQAFELLSREPVDLLFLDVQMPQLSGTDLLRALPIKPVTIFTTAYHEHAVEAFGLDAVDYLPKPFSFPRLVQAVNKARATLRARLAEAPTPPAAAAPAFLTVKSDGKYTRLPVDQILFVEGWQEYVRIHTTQGIFTQLDRLKNLEAALPTAQFMRVHKSYLVAVGKVQSLSGNELAIGPHRIPISRSSREQVLATIFRAGASRDQAG